MMGHKLEKNGLNFNTLINVLESDLKSVKKSEKGLKTLYESEVGDYIHKMLQTRTCNLRELKIVQDAIAKAP